MWNTQFREQCTITFPWRIENPFRPEQAPRVLYGALNHDVPLVNASDLSQCQHESFIPQQTLYEPWYLIVLLNCCAKGIWMRGNYRILQQLKLIISLLINVSVAQHTRNRSWQTFPRSYFIFIYLFQLCRLV